MQDKNDALTRSNCSSVIYLWLQRSKQQNPTVSTTAKIQTFPNLFRSMRGSGKKQQRARCAVKVMAARKLSVRIFLLTILGGKMQRRLLWGVWVGRLGGCERKEAEPSDQLLKISRKPTHCQAKSYHERACFLLVLCTCHNGLFLVEFFSLWFNFYRASVNVLQCLITSLRDFDQIQTMEKRMKALSKDDRSIFNPDKLLSALQPPWRKSWKMPWTLARRLLVSECHQDRGLCTSLWNSFTDIRLTEFGRECIEVADNGHGIEENDFESLGNCTSASFRHRDTDLSLCILLSLFCSAQRPYLQDARIWGFSQCGEFWVQRRSTECSLCAEVLTALHRSIDWLIEYSFRYESVLKSLRRLLDFFAVNLLCGPECPLRPLDMSWSMIKEAIWLERRIFKSRWALFFACLLDWLIGWLICWKYSCKKTVFSLVFFQPGTTIFARNLFHSLPVRREQLTANAKMEFAKLLRLLNGYGIIMTGVRISCSNSTNGYVKCQSNNRKW